MNQPASGPRSRRDIVAGTIFVAIAAAFAAEALTHPIGSALRMGPAFIPLVLAGLLATFGLGVIASGLARPAPRADLPDVPWRAIVLISVAIVIFGAFGRQLGLVPVVFACATVIALSSARNGILAALLIGALLSGLTFVVFKLGLGISLPTFGPLFTR